MGTRSFAEGDSWLESEGAWQESRNVTLVPFRALHTAESRPRSLATSQVGLSGRCRRPGLEVALAVLRWAEKQLLLWVHPRWVAGLGKTGREDPGHPSPRAPLGAASSAVPTSSIGGRTVSGSLQSIFTWRPRQMSLVCVANDCFSSSSASSPCPAVCR